MTQPDYFTHYKNLTLPELEHEKKLLLRMTRHRQRCARLRAVLSAISFIFPEGHQDGFCSMLGRVVIGRTTNDDQITLARLQRKFVLNAFVGDKSPRECRWLARFIARRCSGSDLALWDGRDRGVMRLLDQFSYMTRSLLPTDLEGLHGPAYHAFARAGVRGIAFLLSKGVDPVPALRVAIRLDMLHANKMSDHLWMLGLLDGAAAHLRETMFFEAAMHGNVNFVRRMVASGFDINAQPGAFLRNTALHVGTFCVVEFLLSQGADTSLLNTRGQSALSRQALVDCNGREMPRVWICDWRKRIDALVAAGSDLNQADGYGGKIASLTTGRKSERWRIVHLRKAMKRAGRPVIMPRLSQSTGT